MHIKKELDFTDNPNRPPTGSEVLCAYAAVKGYITSGTGRWDEFRSCKELLKDFATGRIPNASDSRSIVAWKSSIVSTLADGYYKRVYVGARRVLEAEFTDSRSRHVINSVGVQI